MTVKRFQPSECAYGAATAGVDVTLVAAASNTNGIYVNQIAVNSSGSGTCGFRIGSNDVVVLQNGNHFQEDFYIPKNVDFILKSSTANNKVFTYYKVL
jgi:hypothetical protein